MSRRLLLAVLLTLILLGVPPESAPAGAQEIITAVGTFDGLSAPSGVSVEATQIELHFPSEGGEVAGDVSFRLRASVPIPVGKDEYVLCTYTVSSAGRMTGTYDGGFGSVLRGTADLTTTSSIVSGCPKGTADVNSETVSWAATFDGDRVVGVLGEPPDEGTFTATVSRAADPDAGPAPADPAEDAGEPPDNSTDPFVDILEIFAGEAGIEGLVPRINELTDCPEPKVVQGIGLVEPGMGDCPGQRPGLVVATRFAREFDRKITDYSLNERAMKERLSRALVLAGMEGPGGEPLFPSIVTAMPVIKKIASMPNDPDAPDQSAAAFAKREEQALRTVQRFMELLAARDAAQWDKRFP